MSAIVLAGLELTSGAEPSAIITEDSDIPKSAICHITRATLVPTASSATTPATFYLKASISESQDIVLAAINASQPSVGLDLVFHADSTPMFSVTTVPELKGDSKQKFTVHLSGYVDVEVDEEDMDDDDDDGEELTAEEMAAMRKAFKQAGDGEDDEDDDEDEDEEAAAEGEEEGDEDEEDEDEAEAKAPAPKAAAAAAAGNKRKQPPTTETAPASATKQQKTAAAASTAATPAASSTKQTQSKKGAAPATTAAASSTAATIHPSGLTIQDEVIGTGTEANNGRKVSIRYKGQLVTNGKVFDSNMPKGQPFVFTLGGGECIEGFDKGVKGMKVGGRRVIVVPSELGYGKKGSPPTIPPNAALKFTIELIKA